MATEIQNQEQNRIQMLLDVMLTMDDSPANWDITTDEEFDENEPLPTDEEKDELERDLIDIALQTTRRNYTFVYTTPIKKLFQKCHQPPLKSLKRTR
jgi:hypothetical protein